MTRSVNANERARGRGKARGGRGRENDGCGGEHRGPGPTWRYPQLPPSGALRVAPVAFESTASYLGRLAGAYRMGAAQFLDGLGIELDGPGERTGPGPAAPRVEIHLDTEARLRLAAFTRVPHDHLTQALPRPTTAAESGPRPPAGHSRPASTTRWGRPASARRTRRADGRPTRGYASWTPTSDPPGPARCAYDAVPAGLAMSCGRIRPRTACGAPATGIGRASLDCRAPSTQVGYPRSAARIGPTCASRDTVTTRPRTPGPGRSPPAGNDRGHHLARRRQSRLGRLTAGNPAPAATDGGVSPVLLARGVVTYPETVALARAFTTLPHPAPRDTPHGPAHAWRHTRALAHIAGHLELPRLTVAPDDLLWARLHHHNPARPAARGQSPTPAKHQATRPIRPANTHLGHPRTDTPRPEKNPQMPYDASIHQRENHNSSHETTKPQATTTGPTPRNPHHHNPKPSTDPAGFSTNTRNPRWAINPPHHRNAPPHQGPRTGHDNPGRPRSKARKL